MVRFMMIREYCDIHPERVVIGEVSRLSSEELPTTYRVTLAVLRRYGEFHEFSILRDGESVGVFPKAVYKDDKGYHFRDRGKKHYFPSELAPEIEKNIEKFREYLNSHPILDDDKRDIETIYDVDKGIF